MCAIDALGIAPMLGCRRADPLRRSGHRPSHHRDDACRRRRRRMGPGHRRRISPVALLSAVANAWRDGNDGPESFLYMNARFLTVANAGQRLVANWDSIPPNPPGCSRPSQAALGGRDHRRVLQVPVVKVVRRELIYHDCTRARTCPSLRGQRQDLGREHDRKG
jgi:hypothetical protein